MNSTKLLGVLHTKYLVSSRLFTAWLADHLLTANLAQAGFIAQLITVYISDMARNVVNGRSCVRAACEKIREVSR
jgi:mediator of RNA polymerase II transcription subunit 12